jgi:hypothetical protein
MSYNQAWKKPTENWNYTNYHNKFSIPYFFLKYLELMNINKINTHTTCLNTIFHQHFILELASPWMWNQWVYQD